MSCFSALVSCVSEQASCLNEQCSLSKRADFAYEFIELLVYLPGYITMTGLGIIGCVTGGIKKSAGHALQKSDIDEVVSKLYCCTFGILYPEVAEEIEPGERSWAEEWVIRPFIERALTSADSEDSLLEREVASRAKFLVAAVASVVCRVVSLPLGLVAALYSFIPFAPEKEEVAQVAYNNLKITGVIKDLIYCATRIINPRAAVRYQGEKES